MADAAPVPACVQLDHASDLDSIGRAVDEGVDAVMADGSLGTTTQNARFVAMVSALCRRSGVEVEGELGRLAGDEDGLSVEARDAKMTDPSDVPRFIALTSITALAVCVGNVHGSSRVQPHLDLDRLARVNKASSVPLVLHGASGLPRAVLAETIGLGVNKVNVNTELRHVYSGALATPGQFELVDRLGQARAHVEAAAMDFIRAIGWTGV
jgi:tagatose 1,6-diphosphate aldolase GatY/KbaY